MTPEHSSKTTRIYDGRVVALRVEEVEFAGGRTTVHEIVEHRGAVAAVPLTGDGRILMVRQFRPAAGAVLLEIPAGTIEPGESAESCLQRELNEEIGMQAGSVQHLLTFFPSPGFLTEQVHLFLARDLTPRTATGDEEDLTVVPVTLSAAQDMVARGEIRDAKSIIGILLAADHADTAADAPR